MLPNEAPSQEFNQMPTSSEQPAEHHSLSPEQIVHTETEADRAAFQNTASTEHTIDSSEVPSVEIQPPSSEQIEIQAYKNILALTAYVVALTAYVVAMRRAKTGVPR